MISASAGVYQRTSLANSCALALRQPRREQDVGAERRLDLVFLRQRRRSCPCRRTPRTALARSGEPGGNASAISSGNGWMLNQMPFSAISLAVCFVHQVAVLDALHAGGDRPLDRRGRVGVHGDVGAPVLGRFDGGAQLGLGEGGHVERAVRRRHAAARRQLDLRRAQHELLAHAHADLIRTVGDHGCRRSAPRETAGCRGRAAARTAGGSRRGRW